MMPSSSLLPNRSTGLPSANLLIYLGAAHLKRLAGGFVILERAVVRPGQRLGEPNLVVVGDEGLDLDLQIRKRSPHLGEERLEAVGPGALAGCGVVVDGVRCDELVERAQVAAVDASPKASCEAMLVFLSNISNTLV